MTNPVAPPDMVRAVQALAASVDVFAEESSNLRESVLAGTIQRIRYARITAIGSALAAACVVASLILSGVTLFTINQSRANRQAQYKQTTENQARIEQLIRDQNTAGDAARANAIRGAVVSSYCASSTKSITEFKSCLTRNGIPLPPNFK